MIITGLLQAEVVASQHSTDDRGRYPPGRAAGCFLIWQGGKTPTTRVYSAPLNN